jgi:SAM-dependent methyltransferase
MAFPQWFPPLVRRASDWVDLQLSLLVEDLRRVAPLAHGKLLDVGCGDKPFEEIFLPFVSEYVGVEHEASFGLTDASQRGKGPDVVYDGYTLPFEDGSFDTVLNVQVLEHTPHPQRLIDEMARVMRSGGTLIMTAPFSFRLHEQPHDYFRYTPYGLRSMVEKAGLEFVEVSAHGGLFSVMAHKINVFLAFRIARVTSVAQQIGKHSHEGSTRESPRYWTFPVVGPSLVALTAGARLLDRWAPDPTEALSHLILARKA